MRDIFVNHTKQIGCSANLACMHPGFVPSHTTQRIPDGGRAERAGVLVPAGNGGQSQIRLQDQDEERRDHR